MALIEINDAAEPARVAVVALAHVANAMEDAVREFQATGTLEDDVIGSVDWRKNRKHASRLYQAMGELADEFQPKEDSEEESPAEEPVGESVE